MDEATQERKVVGATHLALALSGFTALSVLMLHPLSTDPAGLLYDASGFGGAFLNQPDVTLHAWILAWDTHSLATGNWVGWFDANIFHPGRGALAYSDHMIGALPFFAPIFLLSGQLALSFNLWIVSTFALSGLATYLVALSWTRSRSAALLAGVMFALAPWRFNELSHPQLLSVQFLPGIAYLCLPGAARVGWVRAVLLAAMLALQGTSAAYLGYLGLLVAGLCLAGQLATGADRASCARLSAGMLLGAVPVGLLSVPYLGLENTGAIVAKYRILDAGWLLLGTYLYPAVEGHRWGAWWGVPLLAAAGAVFGLVRAEHRLRAGGLLACLVVSSLFAVSQAREVWGLPVGSLDDAAGWLIPGWSALRVMNRFGIVTWLALSLLSAFAFQGVRSPSVRAGLAIAVASALAVSAFSLDLKTRAALEVVRDPAPYEWLAANGDGAPLLEWPAGLALNHSEAQYMSHRHWLPLVNGYSGYTPPWNELMRSVAHAIYDADALRTFVALDWARWLLVHQRKDALGSAVWKSMTRTGAKLVLEGENYLLFELPYKGDSSVNRLLHPSDTRTLLGTRIERLQALDLVGRVEPATRRLRGPLDLGPLVPIEVANRSTRTWPGVAVARDLLVGVELRARRSGTDSEGVSLGFFRMLTDLRPGASTRVWTRPTGSLAPGTWDLVPCLVQWDGDAGRCHEDARIALTIPEPAGD